MKTNLPGKVYRILTAEEMAERAEIIRRNGGTVTASSPTAQYQSYDGLTAAGMRELIAKGYANPEESQNDAPTIEEMTAFCEAHPGFTIHGYMIGGDRGDSRVSAEGVMGRAKDAKTVGEFAMLFRWADEFTVSDDGGSYCWYD